MLLGPIHTCFPKGEPQLPGLSTQNDLVQAPTSTPISVATIKAARTANWKPVADLGPSPEANPKMGTEVGLMPDMNFNPLKRLKFWRRRRDSNPRYPDRVRFLSRELVSATHPRLRTAARLRRRAYSQPDGQRQGGLDKKARRRLVRTAGGEVKGWFGARSAFAAQWLTARRKTDSLRRRAVASCAGSDSANCAIIRG